MWDWDFSVSFRFPWGFINRGRPRMQQFLWFPQCNTSYISHQLKHISHLCYFFLTHGQFWLFELFCSVCFNRSMPSSFHGNYGKIVYRLEAKLSRSWRLDSCVKQEINFASKAIPNLSHLMVCSPGVLDLVTGWVAQCHWINGGAPFCMESVC